MIWFIIGIILFVITLYVHKHTYREKVGDEYKNRLTCPLWLVILIFFVFCVPYFGISLFFVGGISYCMVCSEEYPSLYLKSEGAIGKIKDLLVNFLNKEL